MAAIVLEIKWMYSVEYIPIDLEGETTSGMIETVEVVTASDGSKDQFIYQARYQYERDANGLHRLALTYVPEDNTEVMQLQDVDFGTSRITIPADLINPAAIWASDKNPLGASGNAISCKVIDADLRVERTLEWNAAFSISRPRQQALRKLLLLLDQRCAITGESTAAALDAAHIKSVADKGVDSVANAILLRADLHRLYDSGGFSINDDGSFRVLADVSDEYRRYLDEARLDERILARIRTRLAS